MARKTNKTSRWIEGLLVLAGAIAIGIWGWSYVHRAVYQAWANLVLNRRMEKAPAKPSPMRGGTPPPAILRDGALIGRLEIPRLNMRSVVREGAGHDTLDIALGHIPGTALPGQLGNVGIAGHRDTLFRGLRKIAKDDVIELETPGGTYRYKVESTGIVKPNDVAVLRASLHSEMTLVTCYPFYYVGSAPDRFIVKAGLMSDPTVPATPPANPNPPQATRPVSADASPVKRPTPHARPASPGVQKVGFRLFGRDSRELVPGIRVGLSSADSAHDQASVWMYVMPERRSISLKNQPAHQAVFFHGHDDGRQRALMITQVTANSVSGYLLQYGSAGARISSAR
jgi:sortase A